MFMPFVAIVFIIISAPISLMLLQCIPQLVPQVFNALLLSRRLHWPGLIYIIILVRTKLKSLSVRRWARRRRRRRWWWRRLTKIVRIVAIELKSSLLLYWRRWKVINLSLLLRRINIPELLRCLKRIVPLIKSNFRRL